MHSCNCSFVILSLTFLLTILSTMRLFSAKWSVAILGVLVPILVPRLVVPFLLSVRLLAAFLVPRLVATLVPRLVPTFKPSVASLVASLSRQIVVVRIRAMFSHQVGFSQLDRQRSRIAHHNTVTEDGDLHTSFAVVVAMGLTVSVPKNQAHFTTAVGKKYWGSLANISNAPLLGLP